MDDGVLRIVRLSRERVRSSEAVCQCSLRALEETEDLIRSSFTALERSEDLIRRNNGLLKKMPMIRGESDGFDAD